MKISYLMKNIFILLILIKLINMQDNDEKCLNTIPDKQSQCLGDYTNKDNNIPVCCYLELTHKNGTSIKRCIMTKRLRDSIEDRIEMFSYQPGIEKVILECSSNFTYLNLLIFIFIFFH